MKKTTSEMLALYAPDISSIRSIQYYEKQQVYNKQNQENLNNDKEHQKYLKQIKIQKEKFEKEEEEKVKRNKEKLIKRQIQIQNESIFGSQDWVNIRIPGKENGKFIKHIFPFPGLKDGDLNIWDSQCLSYALIINPKNPLNVRLFDGSIVPIKLRSNSNKSHNFAVTITKQNVFGFENNKKKVYKKKKYLNEAPDHGQVTIDHIIDGTVQICVIADTNEIIGNKKKEYKLFWKAHPDNAILLYLTGILNGLISERIYDDDDDFIFDRESDFKDIIGETAIDKLLFLLSNIEILRYKINKLKGNYDKIYISNNESDNNSLSNNDIEDNELDFEHLNLKQILQKNKELCLLWISKCSNCPTNPSEFIEYLFSNNGSEHLDYLINNHKSFINSEITNKEENEENNEEQNEENEEQNEEQQNNIEFYELNIKENNKKDKKSKKFIPENKKK